MAILQKDMAGFFDRLPQGDFGHHNFIARLTLRAAMYQSDYEKAYEYCQLVASEFTRRPLQRKEIQNALTSAYQILSGEKVLNSQKKVSIDTTISTSSKGKPEDLEMLQLRSSAIPLNAEEAVSKLFKPDQWINIQADKYNTMIKTAGDWAISQGVGQMEFISYNPFKDIGPRIKENTGDRMYLVHEIDDPTWTKAEQVGPALALEAICPLKMIVDSGGQSLHCWYDWIPGKFEQFRHMSIKLGADPSIYNSPLGLVRLPWGTRKPKTEKGEKYSAIQPILFWRE